jgi:hypothetical protein
MEYTKITRYLKCDILANNNDIEPHGFDKNLSEGNLIDLAVINNCPIIIKGGKTGKWYLKGKGKTLEYLRGKITNNIGKSREGIFCLLLE